MKDQPQDKDLIKFFVAGAIVLAAAHLVELLIGEPDPADSGEKEK